MKGSNFSRICRIAPLTKKWLAKTWGMRYIFIKFKKIEYASHSYQEKRRELAQ
ncbi:hypothetical protein GTCCBUS3UF5_10280 [Geobacillus thermoleovorans CCB_US3_UF5]|nr:hypothetical protein GTCCBUS3UF5_10280 [Geobacillus thermoleovorans CCB_US3_UF5]ESU72230.1 hypothetical protein T260_09185 [Geobacillus sp. MAS1]OKO93149.1 hypothetical protein BRO54_1981 [Geobacillus proteiniphilus]